MWCQRGMALAINDNIVTMNGARWMGWMCTTDWLWQQLFMDTYVFFFFFFLCFSFFFVFLFSYVFLNHITWCLTRQFSLRARVCMPTNLSTATTDRPLNTCVSVPLSLYHIQKYTLNWLPFFNGLYYSTINITNLNQPPQPHSITTACDRLRFRFAVLSQLLCLQYQIESTTSQTYKTPPTS